MKKIFLKFSNCECMLNETKKNLFDVFEKMSVKGKKVLLNFGIVKNKSHKKNSKNYETLFFSCFFFSLPTHFTSNTCFSQISLSNDHVTLRDATFST